MNELNWKCHVCGATRPDANISVYKQDMSTESKLPPGTYTMNVRYCNDNLKCVDGAKTFSFTKNSDE